MAKPRFAHLAILALFLSAGCADNSTTSTTSTPPPLPDRPVAHVFNYSATFDRDRWAEQALLTGSEVFLVGFPKDPLTGGSASASPIQLAVANLTTNQFVEGPTGTRLGEPLDVFAAQGPGVSYVAFDARSPGSTLDPRFEGWITWATYRNGTWDMEEAPVRWAARDLQGLAFFDGAPRVLVRSAQARELWTFDGAWTSEVLADMDPALGRPAMAANATTLFIASQDRAGQPTIWQRQAGSTAYRSFTVQGTAGLLGNTRFALAAPPAAHPQVAWNPSALMPAPGGEILRTYLAVANSEGWEVAGESIPDTTDLQMAGGSDASFVMTTRTDGLVQLHWWDGAAWQTCGFEMANRPRLLTIGDEAFLAYLHTWGAGVVRLTTETASCLVGLDALPGPPTPT